MEGKELQELSVVEEELKFVDRLKTDDRIKLGTIRQQEFWDGYEQGLRFILKRDRTEETSEE